MTGASQTNCRCPGRLKTSQASSRRCLTAFKSVLPNPYWKASRPYRKARIRVMRNRDIRPARKRWAICVETTAIEIPGWALAKRDERFSVSKHHVWFNGRTNGRAKILERQDRQAGGDPSLTAVEWRLCPVCNRMLLSLEAEERRKLDESSKLGREIPCSGECGKV